MNNDLRCMVVKHKFLKCNAAKKATFLLLYELGGKQMICLY